jgi:phenylalanyl-tRNA synthetase beta chain
VDITNYVMFDLGRPSHAYDLAKLSGQIVARRAQEGETATALNGKTYALTPEMTVIADDREVHDIAGIMGGEHSGVSETTSDVLLEVAYFTPERIAKTGQALALTSDARARFERGVDPAFLDDAIAIITALIVEHCGGTPSEITRAGMPPVEARTLAYNPGLCAALGGVAVAAEQQAQILRSLGLTLARHPREGGGPTPEAATANEDQALGPRLRGNDEIWTVTIPTWRRDIDGPADLVEEIVRITSLDHVVSTPLPRAALFVPASAPVSPSASPRRPRAAAASRRHDRGW